MKTAHSWRGAVGVRSPFVIMRAAGEQIAVNRTGAGKPVLCLSATGHGGRDFEAFTKLIVDQGFEVVTLDWPGHGNSPKVQAESLVSARHYAQILVELIPQLWQDGARPLLLGNSIGGAAAIMAAVAYPNYVAGLVISNAGGLAPLDPVARFVIARMVAFFRAGKRGAAWFPLIFSFYYRLVLQRGPAHDQRKRIVKAAPELASLLASAWASFGRSDADIRALVPQLPIPVLWAWAKHDLIVAWSRSRSAAMDAPNCDYTLFPGGHSPFLEAPDAFAKRFLRFAESIWTD